MSTPPSAAEATATTMRAAVIDRFGPPSVVRIAQVKRPKLSPKTALIRVRATSVTSGEARLRSGTFPGGFGFVARPAMGFTGPRTRILGNTYAGTVEAIGPGGSTEYTVGDRVCGMTGMRMGGHAQFVAVDAASAVRIPDGVTEDDAAAALFGGSTAVHFLETLAHVKPGMTVLVNGASGAVGTNAVQLAAHLGGRVTGITSARNAALVQRLGATETIDYAETPVTRLAQTGRRFDVVIDTVGNISPRIGKPLLTDRGVLLLVVADLWNTLTARGNVKAGVASEKPAALERVINLLERGAISAVIDSTYRLDELADAYARVDSGHKVGNVVLHP